MCFPRRSALALRVMSSIRIHATVPIVMLAIKKCGQDPAVTVRKAAAHAVAKVYAMDPTMQEDLIESIDQMLGDRTPMVVSSAIASFQSVRVPTTKLKQIKRQTPPRILVLGVVRNLKPSHSPPLD
jgi:vesicle coat complex subunit